MERRAQSRDDVYRILASEAPYLRDHFGVERLALYGSFARGEPGPHSDVDVLVELSRPLGLQFVALARYLEARLGRRVDLATFAAMRRAKEKRHHARRLASIEEDVIYVQPSA